MSDASGDGSVRITQREVYNLVVEVRDGVRDLVERDSQADAIHKDHETRLRALEVWRWKFAGVVGAVMFVIGTFGYFAATRLVHG